MSSTSLRSLLVFALSAFTLPAMAQYTAGIITFSGAPASQQTALADTAKLHTGEAFSAADLQAAAQRLSDTGFFDDVQVALQGPFKSIAVKFSLKPISPAAIVQVSFGNLFWFTPEELATGIRARVPLFGPSLPEAGTLIDATQAALADMLHQRGINGRLTHDVSEPSPERQARVVTFRVSSPRVVVASVHLNGISAEFAPAFRERAGKVVGSPLDDGLEHRSTNERLLLPYLDAGYLNAHIDDRVLTPTTTTPDKIELDLAGRVVPGPLLHLGALTWTGTPELSNADFAAVTSMHTGDPASITSLSKTVASIAAPYHKEGYADIVIEAVPTIDTSAGTVSYVFTPIPGEQYRIHTITPEGLTPAQQVDFDRGWKMKSGDLFNTDYIAHFITSNTAIRSFEHTSATYKAIRDPAAHLVDVTIFFSSGSSTTVVVR